MIRIRQLSIVFIGVAWSRAATAQQGDFRPAVTFIQINDVYRIDGVKNGASGGPGRVASFVMRTRRESTVPVRTIISGDFVAPSLESRYFAGRPMIDALNFINERAPLLATTGNHEFDENTADLFTGAVRASHFGWIVSNAKIDMRDAELARRFSHDTLITVGAVRIGLFALTLIESPRAWVQVDTAHARIAEAAIEKLERAGADVIVGVTHLDMPVDKSLATLRKRHPKFVWIAGGHEHYLQEEPFTDSTALITKGDANARRIWRVTIGMRGAVPTVRAESIALDERIPVDTTYARTIIERYRADLRRIMPFFSAQIGRANVTLDATEQTVRAGESNWGDYLTDVMRGAFPDVAADIAVLNGGTIRIDDEISGPITWEHLARTFGFTTRVGLVWLRGRDVRLTVLEQGVSADRPEGRFLQVSGVRFAFDRRKRIGERVSGVEIQRGDRWEPLDESRVYVVAVPEYMFGGGDGFHFKDRAVMAIPPGPDLKLMVFDAIAAAYARGAGVGAMAEGRVREIR